jgi:DNA repair exonuclease SbcCD ATPase subunit
MIILKHLTVERFRLLRELNVHFPQRGSILIQGPNESGKSALLESIYFALYGDPLASARGKRSLDDLISYGATSATVTLSLAIGATDLTVTRTIERGKGQSVCLLVHRLGLPEEEPITRLDAANERIVSELGWMDGEALRNSCLIEQKGLERLEQLGGVEREATVRKLLGVENMTRLAAQFQVTPDNELLLKECKERLQLAEIQARIPQLGQQLDDIEAALDAVKAAEDLAEVVQQEADITEQEQELARNKTRRGELKSNQNRVQQLKKADSTLTEIIAAYDGIAEARQQIPELEKQIVDLERREREELPALEKLVGELSDLLRSFGTLQRMSNDLLVAVDSIKDLEQELKQHDEVKDDLRNLEDQVEHARERLQQAKQGLHELEERRRAGRPQLEARLQRLQLLAERLSTLRQLEEQTVRRLEGKGQAEENLVQIQKTRRELLETEHELELVEVEAKQAQQQADGLEKRWRQLAIRRQIDEWYRLEGQAQGLAQAEQHVRMAYQHQEKLNLTAMEARSAVNRYKGFLAGCIALFVISFGVAAYSVLQGTTVSFVVAGVAAIAAVLLIIGAALSFQSFNKASAEAKEADRLVQDAISKVGMMVTARETAMRMAGSGEARQHIEHEIRSLGGVVPRSLEEAQTILQQTRDNNESLAEMQQQSKVKREEASAARNQLNVTMEAVAQQRKKLSQLEELRRREDWDNIDENLENDQAALERMNQEITVLAGQEGLPLPSINERVQGNPALGITTSGLHDISTVGIPELEDLVDGTVRATEREMATLDGKLDMVDDLVAQVKIHQDALDVLLARQKVIEEREERYKTTSPAQQIERTREQQVILRQALQSLQDSLRQRVRPLGVPFGQAAISSAEMSARKQLEELQISLGNKFMLQEKVANYTVQLRELQEALAEHYKQLAKFSNTLGSWIVPPKPFAEALVALRHRCQNEIEAANESAIVKELENLKNQEGAARARIELCRQEIEEAQDRINALLEARKRPAPKSYTAEDIVAVWPLFGEYTVLDREHLEDERVELERELEELEQRELAMSAELQTGDAPLNLAQTRTRMEQQERLYQTKKRGGQMLMAVGERILQKMLPRTERAMQQILPLLTSGRYHDVHLLTDKEEGAVSGGAFQIQVWDSAAGEYVFSDALSAGTAAQLSLALRLAFAIATLPRELNAAPGFIFLDEPLSSFDRGRAHALVDVVSGDALSQHFEQILLISHSNAFDPTMFPYHLYLDNGLVVESNLPVVPSNGATLNNPITPAVLDIPVASVNSGPLVDNDEDAENSGATMLRMPAVSVVKKE